MIDPVSLVRYEAAAAALAEAVRVDEVQEVRSDALKMRAYAKIAKNKTMEADAATIILRAERKLGVLIQSAKDGGLLSQGGRKSNLTLMREKHAPDVEVETGSDAELVSERFTLNEAGIDKKLSMRAQQRARMGDDDFVALLQQTRDRIESAGATPINGSRTVMAGRKEPGASLDYFPTPPWATRALLEDVLDGEVDGVVWEPACGEGHISGVLEEYVETVFATDIHDYSLPASTGPDGQPHEGRSPPGWQGECDFLADDAVLDIIAKHSVDWIVTNSPFSGETDRALAFALKALSIAKTGVALFVRTQWLEGVDRFEQLFGVNPPTVIAQFAERVPLVRGRWDPEASTASQYCWVVWIKDEFGAPSAFQWIPPGRRVARSKQDDVARFTARPVQSIRQDEPAEPVVEGPTTLDGRPETPPPSEGHEGEEAQERIPASDGGSGGSASLLQQTSGVSITPPDSLQAKPESSLRADVDSVAATPEVGADQGSARVGERLSREEARSSLEEREGGVGSAALPDLPHADIAVDLLTKEQQNDIIRFGYLRTPKVTAIELMLVTGLKRSTIEMRAKAMNLADPVNRLNALAELNRRRARPEQV